MYLSIVRVLAAAIALANVAPAAAATGGREIAALLTRSAGAWNRGDLDAFMQSYERSSDTTYVGATSVIRGYANIRAHYARHYGAGNMGVLSFSDLSIRPLGTTYAVVVARYHVALKSGARPTGLFSLVLHRSASGWHIVTDHSP